MKIATEIPEVIEQDKNMLVPFFLMFSYLYYERNYSVVTDEVYDIICKRLYDEWDSIEHFHKHLIEKDSLLAGTGYYIKEYPLRVELAALKYMHGETDDPTK